MVSFPKAKLLWEMCILKKITSLGLLLFCSAIAFARDLKDMASRLLSAEGRVEVARAGQDAWSVGATNQNLQNGDRIRSGVLNITDRDYKLSPLNLYSELRRERTFFAGFKFYF